MDKIARKNKVLKRLPVQFDQTSALDIVSGKIFSWKGSSMHTKHIAYATFLLSLSATSAMAEGWPPVERTVHVPAIGVEAEVPAGSNIYSRKSSIMTAELLSDLKLKNLFTYTIKSDAKFEPAVKNSTPAYCTYREGTIDFKFTKPDFCFIDNNADGFFEKWLPDEPDSFGIKRNFKEPVPYRLIERVRENNPNEFNYVILYQGATSDTIKFSYREFNRDFARPAFTEEINIPREPFPAMVRIKNLQIEVLNISGLGMKYRIVKVD